MNEHLIPSSSSTASEDEDDLQQLTINEHYAKAFQYRKEREELEKLKEKYGSDADTDDLNSADSDSESDESEDEDGEELTPALDAAILRTLARIKARDPGIYDTGRNVFDEEHGKSGKTLPTPTQRAKAHKPVTLPEQRLAATLDDDATSRSASSESEPPSPPPTHVAEQAALRAETIAAFHSSATVPRGADAGNAEEDEEGGLFTLREKTKDEVELEEAEYRAYLEREVGPLENILDLGEDEIRRKEDEDAYVQPAEPKPGKRKRKKGVVEERKRTDQEFLINYILHRGWIDRSARRLPTYKEITVGATSPRDPNSQVEPSGADVDVDVDVDAGGDLEDNEFDEAAERFESSYNFRFEEPDAAHISSFPRAVESVRRPTEHAEHRRAARERRRERKEAEKVQRREEVKRLKGLKTREMEGKLERIGKEGGWTRSQALEALDLDGDWDAEAHDKQMAAVLAETDGVGADGDDKPTWDDDIDVGDIVPPSELLRTSAATERKKEKKKEKKKRGREEDDSSAVNVDEMDADAPNDDGSMWDEVEWDGTEEMRKHVLEQYMEELYGLEFNDMVAGMPTRFRYAPVAKTTYSLTPAEILLADDKDLNEYVSLKKLAPYRKQRDTWDARRRERLHEFKNKVAVRVGAGVISTEHSLDGEHRAKKRKGKKERMREKAARPEEGLGEVAEEVESDSPRDEVSNTAVSEPAKKKRRRQKKAEKPVEQAAT